MFLVKKLIEIQLICLCRWTIAEKVYKERGEPVREIENARVVYMFVWTRPYSLFLWKMFLSRLNSRVLKKKMLLWEDIP